MQKWEKFWRLTILWEREKRSSWIFEKCLCDCWNVKRVSRNHLRAWRCKSCWCMARETSRASLIKINTKHWQYWTRFYSIYIGAKNRCRNKNAQNYKDYWWRWIKFLWDNFEDFYNDMRKEYKIHVEKYWEKDTTIDRIDSNWNYCKENCKWSTKKEQSNNTRHNRILIYNNKKYTLQQLSEEVWLPCYIISGRLKNGRDFERAISEPINKCFSNKKNIK